MNYNADDKMSTAVCFTFVRTSYIGYTLFEKFLMKNKEVLPLLQNLSRGMKRAKTGHISSGYRVLHGANNKDVLQVGKAADYFVSIPTNRGAIPCHEIE